MNESIRVLYVNHGALIGGAETNLLNILRFSPEVGIEAVGMLLPDDGPLVSKVIDLGVPVKFINYHRFQLKNPFRYIQTVFLLSHWARVTRADLVHLNHHHLIEFMISIKRITGCKVVCHVRNQLSAKALSPYLPWLVRADRILGVSNAVLESLNKGGVPRDLMLLNMDGLDASVFGWNEEIRFTFRRELNISNNGQIIGVIGRVVPVKGIEEFLLAAAQVHQTKPDTHFLIVGADENGGQYIAELKQKAACLGLASKVTFTGFRTDIPEILAALDLVVLPSRSDMPEGLPNIVLEALAMGKLVIATRNSGVPEVVTDGANGFLVACDDVEALAGAMTMALSISEGERRAVEAAARESVADRTIENQVLQLAQIYSSLLNN